jgi:predicted TPR repeat methyltransferase
MAMQPQRDNAQPYYDRHSTEYVAKWRSLESGAHPSDLYRTNMITNLIEMANVQPGGRVVEIGAGTGLVLEELLKQVAPVVGTDVSIEMLRRAEEALAQDWHVAIVETLPDDLTTADVYLLPDDILASALPPKRFDSILSMEVFRYVGDLDRGLRNVRRALADGGTFAFSITNRWSLGLFPIKFEVRRLLGRVDLDTELAHYFVTETGIKRTLERCGFRVIELRKLNCVTFNPLVRRRVHSSVGARRAIEIDKRLERVPGANKLFDTFLIACRAV